MRWPSVTIRLLAVLLLSGLAACGSVPTPFAEKNAAEKKALPQPDYDVDARVETLAGPAVPMARLLAQSVSDNLNALNVTATARRTAPARYVVKGRTELNTDGNPAYAVYIHWHVEDAAGQQVAAHTQGVRGSRWHWDYGDPRIIRDVGREAAVRLAGLMRGKPAPAPAQPAEAPKPKAMPLPKEDPPAPASQPAPQSVPKAEPAPQPAAEAAAKPAQPAVPTRGGLWIEQVRGAPGDGDTTLTRAIRDTLRADGVELAASREAARHLLRCRVTTAAPAEGKQDIKILWSVLDPEEREIGAAAQRNAIPAGSLDGPWGPVAGHIALAASSGIRNILKQARAAGK